MKHCPHCQSVMDDDERICPQCPYREPEVEPVSAADFLHRGIARHKKGKGAEAIADLEKALALDPELANARVHLAMVFGDNAAVWLGLKYWDRAMEFFERSIAVQPLATVLNQRAMAYLSCKQWAKAIADASHAQQMDTAYFPALITRAVAYHQQGKIDLALADHSLVLQLRPDYAPAWRNRARDHLARHDYPAAIADLSRALELEPNHPAAHCDRANAHAQLKQYDQALADCNEAIRLDPAFVLAYEHRAKLYRLTGDLGRAREDERFVHPKKWWQFWR